MGPPENQWPYPNMSNSCNSKRVPKDDNHDFEVKAVIERLKKPEAKLCVPRAHAQAINIQSHRTLSTVPPALRRRLDKKVAEP